MKLFNFPANQLFIGTTVLGLIGVSTINTYAWEVQDKIELQQAQQIVADFLSMKEGKKKSKERQKFCCYVIEKVCSPKSDPEQDTVSDIFLEALKPPQFETLKPLQFPEEQPENPLLGLPAELQNRILFYLPYKYQRIATQVSKSFKHMIETTAWTKQEINFCIGHYGKTPLGLTEIPMLTIKASDLESYMPFVRVLWNLTIVDANNDTLKLLSQFHQLLMLDITDSTRINSEGFKYLRNMPLTALNLCGCTEIADDDLQFMPKSLATLDLYGCDNITNAGLQYLKEIPLTALDLSKCSNITDVDLRYLKKMPLLTLNLRECTRLTDGFYVDLPKSIVALDLSKTRIKGGCFMYINLGAWSIIKLDLSECPNLTYSGIDYLPESVITLNLSKTRVNDENLLGLTARVRGLTTLYLRECRNVTNRGISELKKRLPNLNIIY